MRAQWAESLNLNFQNQHRQIIICLVWLLNLFMKKPLDVINKRMCFIENILFNFLLQINEHVHQESLRVGMVSVFHPNGCVMVIMTAMMEAMSILANAVSDHPTLPLYKAGMYWPIPSVSRSLSSFFPPSLHSISPFHFLPFPISPVFFFFPIFPASFLYIFFLHSHLSKQLQ